MPERKDDYVTIIAHAVGLDGDQADRQRIGRYQERPMVEMKMITKIFISSCFFASDLDML